MADPQIQEIPLGSTGRTLSSAMANLVPDEAIRRGSVRKIAERRKGSPETHHRRVQAPENISRHDGDVAETSDTSGQPRRWILVPMAPSLVRPLHRHGRTPGVGPRRDFTES